ncbi:hypothetical protein BKP45_11360 [Anaerobacillus alkalidiazotrophicus]|uniref:Aromatic amino acid beta-eliminating lyase/threonine aldolase domain-containing protein n=1 Tax=Anaerobacillus alkalidiazotrophicus TaxID=472963 RepID=A0A1S2M4J5_9BACI|nr:hypothetical protein BKP45_17075 [Anaerobacillus alkalidiazotrophicus]OIJ19658.1 hypothetical protein BKP45_11360 [Anaerobacillus alkalidiazotrophicus]
MVDRLAIDHENAKILADGLDKHPFISVINKVETNIVLIDITKTGKRSDKFIEALKQVGILAVPFGPKTIRFTTHYDVSKENIKETVNKVLNLK